MENKKERKNKVPGAWIQKNKTKMVTFEKLVASLEGNEGRRKRYMPKEHEEACGGGGGGGARGRDGGGGGARTAVVEEWKEEEQGWMEGREEGEEGAPGEKKTVDELRKEVDRLRVEVEMAARCARAEGETVGDGVRVEIPQEAVVKGFTKPEDFVVVTKTLEYSDGSVYEVCVLLFLSCVLRGLHVLFVLC